MAIGWCIPIILWLPTSDFIQSVLIGAGILVAFGLADDLKNLGYKIKLVGQISAALVLVSHGNVLIRSFGSLIPIQFEGIVFESVSILLTLLVIIGVTNAINLSDGLDGLAGGISMLCFVCIGFLAYKTENTEISVMAIAITGTIFGFLRFNTHPASVFMGDTGSQLLGFLAIAFSLQLTQSDSPYSPILPLIIIGFPVLDTLVVMTERIAKGHSPFVADKNHFHHKLIRLGFFHSEAVFIIYVLQACLVSSAYIFRFYSEWFLLIVYCGFSGTIIAGFLLADRASWQFKRYDLFDRVIKGRLKAIKEQNIAIKVSFRILKYGLPTLFFLTCFIPSAMPLYLPVIALIFIFLIVWIRLFVIEFLGSVIRLSLYLIIPFLAYIAEIDIASWLNSQVFTVYNISFGVLTIFVIFTLKFTRRTKGFKTTPMDFLILFIALIGPNLADLNIETFNLGMLTVRVIIFLFSYEVLIGELRKEYDGLALSTVLALMILAVRGIHFNL
ncbi:MAG: MraY family glycosyltransferase [Thermodesulfobacteriota bacterium]